jgi:hypothetical protein
MRVYAGVLADGPNGTVITNVIGEWHSPSGLIQHRNGKIRVETADVDRVKTQCIEGSVGVDSSRNRGNNGLAMKQNRGSQQNEERGYITVRGIHNRNPFIWRWLMD